MIKAVIFDIDGVLLDSMEANIAFFQDLLQSAGYRKPSRKIIKENFHLTMIEMIKALLPRASEKEILRAWNMGKTTDRKKYRELSKIPDRSAETIRKLSRKYRLGIVTGRIRAGVDSFFDVCKTRKYFSAVACFEDYEKPKPDAEPLLCALKKLGTKPEEAVYVGDAIIDMQAAKAAGTHFILYSKKKIKGAKYMARSFYQMPEIISGIEGAGQNDK